MTTQEKLDAAFKLVEPKTHWKDRIDAVVDGSADRGTICMAVIHFTGSVPQFTDLPDGRVRVRARGYWEAIGA